MSKHFLKQHLKFNQTLNKTYIQIHCDLVMFRKVINKGIIVLKIIIWIGINRWFYKRKFRFMATQQRKCDHKADVIPQVAIVMLFFMFSSFKEHYIANTS